MSGPPDDFDDDLDDRDFDEEDGDDDNCGLDFETGQCANAGSEDCDWNCRWRNSEYFAGNKNFRPKRKRKKKAAKP